MSIRMAPHAFQTLNSDSDYTASPSVYMVVKGISMRIARNRRFVSDCMRAFCVVWLVWETEKETNGGGWKPLPHHFVRLHSDFSVLFVFSFSTILSSIHIHSYHIQVYLWTTNNHQKVQTHFSFSRLLHCSTAALCLPQRISSVQTHADTHINI